MHLFTPAVVAWSFGQSAATWSCYQTREATWHIRWPGYHVTYTDELNLIFWVHVMAWISKSSFELWCLMHHMPHQVNKLQTNFPFKKDCGCFDNKQNINVARTLQITVCQPNSRVFLLYVNYGSSIITSKVSQIISVIKT